MISLNEFLVKKHVKNTIELIDLGLPSGIQWAKYNIGSKSYDDPGLYFQWSRVDGYKKNHELGTSFEEKNGLIKTAAAEIPSESGKVYTTGMTLNKEDDAATVILGNGYSIPSPDDFEELLKNTKHRYVKDYNGAKGFLFETDKNELFIPLCDLYTSFSAKFVNGNSDIYLWTNEKNTNEHATVFNLCNFTSPLNGPELNKQYCRNAMPIRAVHK